jgi:hypothetical protein
MAPKIEYLSGGIGAEFRPVADKLADIVSVKDFGAAGNGTNQDGEAQAAYDALISGGGGTLCFPRGDYRLELSAVSRTTGLEGEGRQSSIIKPTTNDGVALQFGFALAGTDGPNIARLGLAGVGARQGTGIRCGGLIYSENVEYVGFGTLEKLHVRNFDKGFHRPWGNIGFSLTDCVFYDNNYGLFSVANPGRLPPDETRFGDPMHAGCLNMLRGQIQFSRKAAVYIDGKSVIGSGQILFDSTIFEANPGWVFYVKDFNDRDRVPAPRVRDCWSETNNTAPSVDVEGDVRQPRYGHFSDVPYWIFENTPVGSLDLRKSQIVTKDCPLDAMEAVDMDAESTLFHDGARLFTGTAFGIVRSIGGIDNVDADNNNTPWYPMPVPKAFRRLDPSRVLLLSHGQVPETWTGATLLSTTTVSDDPALCGLPDVQQLTCTTGPQMYPSTAIQFPAGKWIVSQIVLRHVAGSITRTVPLLGASGRGGGSWNRNAEWRTMTSIVRNDTATAGSNFFWHFVGADSVLRFAGYAITAWDSFEDALDFANSGAFPAPPVQTYAVANAVASRAFDADTVTTAELADIVATLVGDLASRGIVAR